MERDQKRRWCHGTIRVYIRPSENWPRQRLGTGFRRRCWLLRVSVICTVGFVFDGSSHVLLELYHLTDRIGRSGQYRFRSAWASPYDRGLSIQIRSLWDCDAALTRGVRVAKGDRYTRYSMGTFRQYGGLLLHITSMTIQWVVQCINQIADVSSATQYIAKSILVNENSYRNKICIGTKQCEFHAVQAVLYARRSAKS